jgi:hypothetical protein
MRVSEYRAIGGHSGYLYTDIRRGNVILVLNGDPAPAEFAEFAPTVEATGLEPDPPSPGPNFEWLKNRPKPKRTKVGPWSCHLTFGQLDPESPEGQYVEGVQTALYSQFGDMPTPAQQIVIQMVSIKLLRCELLARRVLSNDNLDSLTPENYFLSWSNSIRHDLNALGLAKRPPPPFDPDEMTDAQLDSALATMVRFTSEEQIENALTVFRMLKNQLHRDVNY